MAYFILWIAQLLQKNVVVLMNTGVNSLICSQTYQYTQRMETLRHWVPTTCLIDSLKRQNLQCFHSRCIAKFIENAQSNFCFLQKHFVQRIKSAINNTHGFLLALMVARWNTTQICTTRVRSNFFSLDEYKLNRLSCLKNAGSVCLPKAPELSSLCTACAEEVSLVWSAACSHCAHTHIFLNAHFPECT